MLRAALRSPYNDTSDSFADHMDNYPRLAPAAYVIALMLIVFPIFDSVMSVVPLHFENAQWRFGAFGLLSNTLLIPLAGVLIALAVALAYEHEGMQKLLWVGSWTMAALLMLAVVLFALDSLQTRSHIRADIQTSFKVASVTGLAKLFFSSVAFGLFGWVIPGGELFNLPEIRLRRS